MRIMTESPLKKKSGFTLVEAVVTIVILSIISFVVMYVMVEGFRVWWENRGYIELRADGRAALDRIAAELRESDAVTLTSPQELEIHSDVNGDGAAETIVYELSGADLVRTESASSPVICSHVSALTFSWNQPMLTVDMTLADSESEVALRAEAAARRLP
jgi:prepilin-type N-terminal cleavage/methylation domain-containing protein